MVRKGKYKGESVVVKEITERANNEVGKKVIKEAEILHCLDSCRNIAAFLGVCLAPLSIMMEYVCFDFKPFGGNDTKVSGLDSFLNFVDSFQLKTMERMVDKIASDIIEGLHYLHSKKIAHRDLKPSNLLVCNQHYANIDNKEELLKICKEEPIICKLADFGESRSKMLQTRSLLKTHTVYVRRGTMGFMAPEQFPGKFKLNIASQEQLFSIDIWMLGMCLFCLLNLDSSPFAN